MYENLNALAIIEQLRPRNDSIDIDWTKIVGITELSIVVTLVRVLSPLKFITMRMKVNIEDNTMLMESFIDDVKTI